MVHIIRINQTQGDLVFDLFDRYRVFYKKPSDPEVAKAFIQQRLDQNESVVFVALDAAGRPMGFTQLYPHYSSVRVMENWILNDLYVHESYRRRGVGKALIDKAMDFARKEHSIYMELSTAVDNYRAQRLYEQIGFKKVAPESDFFTYRIGLAE